MPPPYKDVSQLSVSYVVISNTIHNASPNISNCNTTVSNNITYQTFYSCVREKAPSEWIQMLKW